MCTYRNSPEAFKCDMCDVCKGTSTRSGRKPRVNPAVVQQQVAQQTYTPPVSKKEKRDSTGGTTSGGPGRSKDSRPEGTPSTSSRIHNKNRPPRLKNIDRSSGRSMEVTVGAVTVIITEYQPKPAKHSPSSTGSLSPGDDHSRERCPASDGEEEDDEEEDEGRDEEEEDES